MPVCGGVGGSLASAFLILWISFLRLQIRYLLLRISLGTVILRISWQGGRLQLS
jgi:hypothetical protein